MHRQQGVLARFQEQNVQIREYLSELKPSGVVNEAVFRALDHFDEALSGQLPDKKLQDVAALIFSDFTVMGRHSIRAQIAGSKTGPGGIDHADLYGFINYLKNCDAEVQWALFMPDKVRWQGRHAVPLSICLCGLLRRYKSHAQLPGV